MSCVYPHLIDTRGWEMLVFRKNTEPPWDLSHMIKLLPLCVAAVPPEGRGLDSSRDQVLQRRHQPRRVGVRDQVRHVTAQLLSFLLLSFPSFLLFLSSCLFVSLSVSICFVSLSVSVPLFLSSAASTVVVVHVCFLTSWGTCLKNFLVSTLAKKCHSEQHRFCSLGKRIFSSNLILLGFELFFALKKKKKKNNNNNNPPKP